MGRTGRGRADKEKRINSHDEQARDTFCQRVSVIHSKSHHPIIPRSRRRGGAQLSCRGNSSVTGTRRLGSVRQTWSERWVCQRDEGWKEHRNRINGRKAGSSSSIVLCILWKSTRDEFSNAYCSWPSSAEPHGRWTSRWGPWVIIKASMKRCEIRIIHSIICQANTNRNCLWIWIIIS